MAFRARFASYIRQHHLALIALFVALGGVSYAAVNLPSNSVGTKQLRKNAVVSSKVKNGSLRSADFGAGQLPAGPAGATGATGPAGSPDTPQQVLGKITQVDGYGSGLDAETIAGMSSGLVGTLGTDGGSYCGDDDHESGGGSLCGTVTLDLPRPARVLLVASADALAMELDDNLGVGNAHDAPGEVRGSCGIYVDGATVGSHRRNVAMYHLSDYDPIAVTEVSDPLPAGSHDFSLRCRETDGDIHFMQVNLTAVMIGNG